MSKTDNSRKILVALTCVLLGVLFLLDERYRVNHVFALIIVMVIYNIFKDCSFKRLLYYITISFAVMGAALSIPISEDFFLTRFNIYYLFIGIYVICSIIEMFKNKTSFSFKNIFDKKINIIAMLFIIYVFASIFIANNKGLAIKQLFIYVVMFMLFGIIINENRTIKQRKDTYRVLLCVSIGILAVGSIKIITALQIEPRSVYTDFNIIKDASREYMRRIPTVFFYNPNDYAMVLVLIMLGYLGKIISVGIKDSKSYLVLYLVAQINLIFTCSRAGWISLVIAILGFVMITLLKFNKEVLKKSVTMLAITIIVFIGLSYIPFTEAYYGKLKNTSNEISRSIKNKPIYLVSTNDKVYMDLPSQNKGDIFFGVKIGEESSINRRVTLIYDVLKGVFKEKNYFGFGVGNTAQYIMEQNNTYGLYSVHSLWFEILGDFGVVGFILFISMYLYLFIDLVKRRLSKLPENIIGIPMLIAIAMLVFGPSSVTGFTPFWIAMAMIYANVINYKNRIEEDEEYGFNK